VYDGDRFALPRVGHDRNLCLVFPYFGIALAIRLVFVALGAVLG
jgi:hypothetical protein